MAHKTFGRLFKNEMKSFRKQFKVYSSDSTAAAPSTQ